MFQQMGHTHGIPSSLGRDGAARVALALTVESNVKPFEGDGQIIHANIDRGLEQSPGARKRDLYSFVTLPDETANFALDLGLYLGRKRAARRTANQRCGNCNL